MEVIKMHISQWKYKEDLLYIQMEYYLAREKKTNKHIFVSLLMRQFNPQHIIHSEKKLERDRQILFINAYKWNLGRQ